MYTTTRHTLIRITRWFVLGVNSGVFVSAATTAVAVAAARRGRGRREAIRLARLVQPLME